MPDTHEKESNYAVFRECLSNAIVSKSAAKPTRSSKRRAQKAKRRDNKKDADGNASPSSNGNDSTVTPDRVDPEEIGDFIDVCVYGALRPSRLLRKCPPPCLIRERRYIHQFIASETFSSLPDDFQSLSYSAIQHEPSIADKYTPTPLSRPVLDSLLSPVPVSVAESLSVYGMIPDSADLPEFLAPVLNEFVTSVTTGPPVWASTRTDACEICERDWIPLSYHHLIPRAVHAKVLKKGWHDEWMLNSVAWLCRACHSFVHRMASNEELAREWFTVERILEREDVREWAKWVGRVRWKAK